MVDGGESAKNLNRPGLRRLLTLVDSGRVEAVIIAKLDRLTRSVKDLCSLLELFEKRGVALISVAESLDTASAAGRPVITIMAAVSQWEREAIGKRTRDALRHKSTSGERVGNIRFGFRLSPDGKHVEPDPGEQGVLTEIRHPTPERAYVARDCGRPEPQGAANAPWLGLAAGARSANHQAGNRSSLIHEGWRGRFIGTRKTSKNHLVSRKTHLAVKDGDSFCRGGRRMKRELAKVLLDEIVRTRAQLVRLQMVLARGVEERSGQMEQCEECERLWKAYQTATIESVQLYEELRSINEDQGLEKLSGTTTRAEAAERLREEARRRLTEHQAATGHR
jgi:hypothetical protein